MAARVASSHAITEAIERGLSKHASFGGRCLRVSGCRLLPCSEQPGLQPGQVDVDDRRRVKSENLRQRKAADDGVTEWLGDLPGYPRARPHLDTRQQRR